MIEQIYVMIQIKGFGLLKMNLATYGGLQRTERNKVSIMYYTILHELCKK
jgi:hypothetical protein